MRYLIRLKEDPSAAALSMVDTTIRSLKGESRQYLSRVADLKDSRSRLVDRVSGHKLTPKLAADAVEMANNNPDLEIIPDEPISLIRPAPVGSALAEGAAPDTWHLRKVFGANARADDGGEGVTVAVLDTGATEVPEIAGRVSGHYELDLDQWQVSSVAGGDTDGHGTHVSGLICGGTVGVAPPAKVESVAMIPGGQGTMSNFILAMEWVAVQPDISILNMSAGIPGYRPGMQYTIEIIENFGVLTVIATRNEGVNSTRSPGNYVEPISVGASTRDDRVASFSGGADLVVDNVSYTVPDLVAPGAAVTSCVMGGGYEAWNGTSMATPIVSGIAALMIQRDPEIAVTDLKEQLIVSYRNLRLPAK
jgi:subtilisin family serine protease